MDTNRKSLKGFKITSLVIYIIVTVILLLFLVPAIPDLISDEDGWAALGGVLLMVVSLCICIAYIIPVILSIVGLVKTKQLEGEEKTKNKIQFILLLIAPLLTTLFNFLAYFLLLTN